MGQVGLSWMVYDSIHLISIHLIFLPKQIILLNSKIFQDIAR